MFPLGPPTFLDVLLPASLMLLLPYCPLLQNHYGPRVDLGLRADIPQQPEIHEEPLNNYDRHTDISDSSSEADNPDGSDFVASDNESQSSGASSQPASPAGPASDDDEPDPPQDNFIRQSPYGQNTCAFYYDRLDNHPVSERVKLPECFRNADCCKFIGDRAAIRKNCTDHQHPHPSTVCTHVRRGAVKDRRAHEMGHFYSFICVDCRDSRRSWPSLVNMPFHKKKFLVKHEHTFVTVSAGAYYYGKFCQWLSVNRPQYLDSFEMGPGNLVHVKKGARERR